jgi:PelA/Pel-15E family pectate lyase
MPRLAFTRFFLLSVLVVFAAAPLSCAVIGPSQPAESITAARVALLPGKDRAAWTAYLERSQRQMQIDRATLAAERAGGPEPALPKEGFSARTMPLNRDAEWYGTIEARHVADVIVSFQTPAGGWSKNLDMSGAPRARGQSYTTDNLSKHPGADDFDTPKDAQWNYVGTLDNDATNTELRFLARISGATPDAEGAAYRAGFLRGVRYLLAAQLPNGGWPQVWPLEGGYHDAITFNDNAVTESAATLTAVAAGAGDYAFVPAELRREAAAGAARALECILATQVMVKGRRTVWAQQHDALTLAPVAGRNYEPAALSSGESSDVLLYLMHLPHPSPAVIAAVDAGVTWLKAAAITGQQWVGGRGSAGGRHLEAKAGAAPIWARFYSIESGLPVFGDRDKTIHDNVNELSLERRNGYAWYGAGPQRALDACAAWSRSHGGRRGQATAHLDHARAASNR